MKAQKLIFAICGLIGGLLISSSLKKLYGNLTHIELPNIIDYED